MAKDSNCELCNEARISPWLFEDDRLFVAICISCNLPMIVLRDHRCNIDEDEAVTMRQILAREAKEYFGEAPFFIDEVMRQIPDHKHMHARRRPQVPNF